MGKRGMLDDLFDFLFTVIVAFFLLMFIGMFIKISAAERNEQAIINTETINEVNNHLLSQRSILEGGGEINLEQLDHEINVLRLRPTINNLANILNIPGLESTTISEGESE